MPKKNKNVLQGIRCPKCGALEPFDIVGKACFLAVIDDGVDDFDSVEWDSDDYCKCRSCKHEATVADFTEA